VIRKGRENDGSFRRQRIGEGTKPSLLSKLLSAKTEDGAAGGESLDGSTRSTGSNFSPNQTEEFASLCTLHLSMYVCLTFQQFFSRVKLISELLHVINYSKF
jgi:hypothetical protein